MSSILFRYFYCIFILTTVKRQNLYFINILYQKSTFKKSQTLPYQHKLCFWPTSVSIYFTVLLHLYFIQSCLSIRLIFIWTCWWIWVRIIKIAHCERFIKISLNGQMSMLVHRNLFNLLTLCRSSRFTNFPSIILLTQMI